MNRVIRTYKFKCPNCGTGYELSLGAAILGEIRCPNLNCNYILCEITQDVITNEEYIKLRSR